MASPNHKKAGIVKERIGLVADWILDHTKIVMPLILVVCVLITVVIALNANERTKLEKEAEIVAANATDAEEVVNLSITIPDIPLEENSYPEINELITNYYKAVAEGDIEAATAIDVDLDDLSKIRIEEMSKYIDYYDTVKVYTKVGLTEGSYVTYVYVEVKFKDLETLLPGFQTYYVVKENDKMIIKKNDLDENVYEYIKAVSLQDDVVDLNNKITVEFNDLIASDKELEEFIAYMTGKINEDVGVVLAQNEQPDINADTIQGETDAAAPAEAGQSEEQPSITTVKTAKATDVVNIRSSDSETADRLDKALVGQEFTVLEQKGNGWSRIKYKDGDAYIKSQYLEITSQQEVQNEAPEAQQTTPAESASQVSASGTVKVKESVRVRSTPGTDGEVLGTVYGGDKLDMIEQSNGWTKVKYKGKVGYIKSDYVE